jgi:large subunit ribosomal protein L28
MKPNVKTRNLHSDVLNQDFKLDITMKARKCIIKAGSLDNYLLNTKPADIDSKFGLYLRELIQRKKAPIFNGGLQNQVEVKQINLFDPGLKAVMP